MTFDLWDRDCQKALNGVRGHLHTKYELHWCSCLGGRLDTKCVGKEEKEKEKSAVRNTICLHVTHVDIKTSP